MKTLAIIDNLKYRIELEKEFLRTHNVKLDLLMTILEMTKEKGPGKGTNDE